MDRRAVAGPAGPDGKPRHLGWPGVSCEVWGASGAFGGEVYGWGAVMPAHIIRNLMGLRETEDSRRMILAPSFGASMARQGQRYGITGFSYGNHRLDVAYTFADGQRIQVEVRGAGVIQAVTEVGGHPVRVEQANGSCRFDAVNHQRYEVTLAG